MQRDEILRRLEDLVPEIQASRDAEGTLLKFAKEHNLAPAQLETLAQVYNNGKALTFYAKSANRGGTFKLVETEPLLEKYTDHVDNKKLKCKSDCCKSASETSTVDGGRFPHYDSILESTEALEKSASITEQLDRLSSGVVSIFRDKALAKEACDMASEMISARMDDIRAALTDIRDNVRFDKPAFTRLEEDVLDIYGSHMKYAFDKAAEYLRNSNCDVDAYRFDPTKATDRAVAKDTTGFATKMASVYEDLDFIKASNSFIADFEKAAVGGVVYDTRWDEAKKQQAQLKRTGVSDTKKHPNPAPEPRQNPGTISNHQRASGDGSAPVSPGRPRMSANSEDEHEFKGEKGKEQLAMDGFLSGLIDRKGNPSSAKPSAPLTIGKKLIGELSSGKDIRQQKRDTAVTEDSGVAAVQRLMMSDPILAEASPEEVISHYNTIMEIAPDVATDLNKLRLPLREAVQYGSIPMHTLKELLEINKLIQGNRSLVYKNDAVRYGGAKPKSLKDDE